MPLINHLLDDIIHNFYEATLCIPSRSWVKISWESFPFNLKMNCSQSMFFFSFCQRRAICCKQKLWIVGFCRKSPKSVQRQFQLKYVDFFPFPGRKAEKSEKCTRCGSRPEFLTGVHRRGVRVVIWAPTDLANRGGKAEKLNSWYSWWFLWWPCCWHCWCQL